MRIRFLLAFAFLALTATGHAIELAGIDVPEQLTNANGHTLQLNGAGVRRRFITEVYVAALYLPSRTQSVETVLQQDGPVVMRLHILHSEVPEERLVKSWAEGFEDNLSGKERSALAARVHRFNGLFRTVRAGETITLEYQPGSGTTVHINDDVRGVIEGKDFARAWLKIWLGRDPADDDLKRALLGGAN